MPSSRDRQQLSSEELTEQALTGPFGGIQSELPVSLIEDYGFADCQNLTLRFGTAQHRPTYTTLPALPAANGEYVISFATFWDANGNRQQVAITNIHILQWAAGAWNVLAGPIIFANFPQVQPWSFSVLNNKLCFANGGVNVSAASQVFIFDPVVNPGNYTLSNAASPSPLNIAEIGLHLMTNFASIQAAGTFKPMRYEWSGVADPTDWASFSFGTNDIVIDLGPAVGLQKLGQYGFGYHMNGILQIIPTGIGTAPFAFVPIIGADIGQIAYGALQKLTIGGLDTGIFVGPDNVYIFNQSSLTPIGSAPIGNRRQLGARQRIIADVQAAITGPLGIGAIRTHANHSPGGSPFMAFYLLCIASLTDPTKCPLWIYNFDEDNWTRWIFNKPVRSIGSFALNPGSFVGDSSDKIGIGFNDWTNAQDATVGWIDFSNAGSETSVTVKSGKCIFSDRRHGHTNQKFRLAFTDLGSVSWTLTLTNEAGQTAQQTATLGTGSGDDLSYIFSVKLRGLRIQWTLTAPSGSKFSIVELAPIFDTSGEQRGGSVDNN